MLTQSKAERKLQKDDKNKISSFLYSSFPSTGVTQRDDAFDSRTLTSSPEARQEFLSTWEEERRRDREITGSSSLTKRSIHRWRHLNHHVPYMATTVPRLEKKEETLVGVWMSPGVRSVSQLGRYAWYEASFAVGGLSPYSIPFSQRFLFSRDWTPPCSLSLDLSSNLLGQYLRKEN